MEVRRKDVRGEKPRHGKEKEDEVKRTKGTVRRRSSAGRRVLQTQIEVNVRTDETGR